MKRKLIFFILLLFTLFLIFVFPKQSSQNPREKIITLSKTKLTVEVADNDERRVKGLSGRVSLPQNQGMLFVFSKKSNYSFWMKEMSFPLDFVWIDGEKVVDITQNVPYPKDNEQPVSIIPQAPVDKVLEVNAGVVETSGVKIGDQIEGF